MHAAVTAALHVCVLGSNARAADEAAAPSADGLAEQVQAAFVTKFPQFIEWPREALDSDTEHFRICLLGDVEFASDIEAIAATRRVHGRSLQIVRLGPGRSFGGCRVLFLGDSEAMRLPRILDSVKAGSVLTVSAMDRFVERGGMIGFFRRGGHVGFHINREAAKEAGLVVSSQLLKLSEMQPAAGKPASRER